MDSLDCYYLVQPIFRLYISLVLQWDYMKGLKPKSVQECLQADSAYLVNRLYPLSAKLSLSDLSLHSYDSSSDDSLRWYHSL